MRRSATSLRSRSSPPGPSGPSSSIAFGLAPPVPARERREQARPPRARSRAAAPCWTRYAAWRWCPSCATCSPMSCSSAAYSSSSRSSAPSPCSSSVWSKSSSASRATWRECASGQLHRRARLCTDARRIARGSSVQSAGSWCPMASRRMPSRKRPLADRQLVEVEQLHRGGEEHRAGDDEVDAARLEPVHACAARTPSTPGSRRAAARNSSRVNVSWLSDAGTCAPRRAATMAARSSRVPLLPTTSFGSNAAHVTRDAVRSDVVRCVAQRASVRLRDRVGVDELGGEAGDAEVLARRPLQLRRRSPTMISTLPPPRSKHSAGAGSSSTLARMAPKISRASVRPLITSTSTPVSRSMRSTSSSPLAAQADGAGRAGDDLGRRRRPRRACFMRRTVATAASAASGGMKPSRLTTSPRRSISFSRASGVKVPSGCTSATRRWNEFVPRSSAAMRIEPDCNGAAVQRDAPGNRTLSLTSPSG